MLRHTAIGFCAAALTILAAGCQAVTPSQAAMPANAAPSPVAGQLTVEGAVARPAPLEGGNGAAYLTVWNGLEEDVQLQEARSDAAATVELHETVEESGVMRMVPHPEGFTVPAGGSLVLKPGGKHVMLLGLVQPLTVGDTIDLGLQFDNGTAITLTVPVTDIMGMAGAMPMDMTDGGAAEPTPEGDQNTGG